MSRTNGGSRDVAFFLLATSCLTATTAGVLVWNAAQVRRRQTQKTQFPIVDDLHLQSTGRLAVQLPGYGNQIVVNATTMHGESKLRWWWPTNSEFIYLLNLRGDEATVNRLSVMTGEGTRITELKQRRYNEAFGTEDQIYMLRTDTRGRYQIIADIYSVPENRMVATRSLLNLPIHFSSRPVNVLWHPNGSSVSLTVVQFSRNNEPTFRTYVIDLQTGLPIKMPHSEPFLKNQRALAFNNDGSRLFLIRDDRNATSETENANVARSLVVLDTQSGESQETSIAEFPRKLPLAISDDATLLAFGDPSSVDIWNSLSGEKTATVPIRTDGGSPWQVAKVQFCAGGDLVAVADGRTLSVYATDTGVRISRFPDVPPNDQTPMIPVILGRNTGKLVVIGTSLEGYESAFRSELWMHRISFNDNGSGKRNIRASVAEATSPVTEGHDHWTPWMSSEDYGAEFKTHLANGKYPIKVVGRNKDGESQFRAQFIDLPDNLEFFARHNVPEESPSLPKFRNRRGQLRSSDNRTFGIHRHAYQEIWRQWFVDQKGITRYNIVWTKAVVPE